MPVYHYDHIDEYSAVKEHAAENLTLLCAYHHDLKTRRQLPVQHVRQCNAAPFALTENRTASHNLYFSGLRSHALLGGVSASFQGGSATALQIGEDEVVGFAFEDGHMALNVDIRDRKGASLLRILRNELVVSTGLEDCTFIGQRLRLSGRDGTYITFRFAPEYNFVSVEKALIYHKGVGLHVRPGMLVVLNNKTFFSGILYRGNGTAVAVNQPQGCSGGPCGISIDVPRGDFDQEDSVKWAYEVATPPLERVCLGLPEMLPGTGWPVGRL
jgi:trigger factor